MRPRLYLETTIPGYLTARRSRDLVTAAHQELTRRWWDNRSQKVVEEAGGGDANEAARRLDALKGIPVLEVTREARDFAKKLIKQVPLPAKAAVDGLHIALAVVHAMDYLLTWNCSHIANAALRDRIERVCRRSKYKVPVICTPEELLEE
jgi:hypothetical protein